MALCFVAVLGISLASYIALCSRAMTLSNRAFQNNLSQELAEAGLEEALRAFNKNDWSDWSNSGYTVDWDTTTYAADKRAVGTLSFPTGKFGQGTTATVKLRVDNYDAAVLGSTWSSTANYRINDLVGRNGVWYRCVKTHSNQTPNGMANLAYWVPAPIPWTWQSNVSYKLYDVVNYNGTWYRCTAAHTSPAAWTGANWTSIHSISLYSFSGSYVDDDIVYFPNSTTWYRYSGGSWLSTAGIAWQYLAGTTYSYNDVVCYYSGGAYNWYRYIYSTPASGVVPTNTTYWENAPSGTNTTSSPGLYGWSSSGLNYNLRDSVYYSGQWYRCIKAHTSSSSLTPANTAYWTSTPPLSTVWDSGRQYSQNDTARYNGVWYLSLQSSNVAQNPSTATTYWIGANTTDASYTWNTTSSYAVGDYRCYGGVWYRCTTAHTNRSPNDTGYWAAVGAPVVYAEAAVTIANNPTVKTQLRAPLAPAPLFPNALAATSTISANSGGTVDSYDSTVGTPSATQYSNQTGSSTNYSAVVAAGNTSGTAITLSSPTIQGYVAAPPASSAPYAPLLALGTSTVVKGSAATPSPKVDVTRVSRSPAIPQFDTLPGGANGLVNNWATTPGGSALVLSTTTNIGTPGATTPSRYYYNGSLTLGGASITYLKINGPVILYIKGDLLITQSSATGRIDLNSAGSAEIHVSGSFKADVSGEGIKSYTYDPKSLVIICDSTSSYTHLYSEGVNALYGAVYIPYNTSNTGYYNSNNNTQVYGAISTTKVTYSGANLNLHYDTSLRYATIPGVDQPYAATEWRELPITEQATMP